MSLGKNKRKPHLPNPRKQAHSLGCCEHRVDLQLDWGSSSSISGEACVSGFLFLGKISAMEFVMCCLTPETCLRVPGDGPQVAQPISWHENNQRYKEVSALHSEKFPIHNKYFF